MDQPDLDHDIDHDDDDDDDDDEQEANRTQPFQPGTVSTPYHGGEQHEMQTMQHEQSGRPETSFEEDIPLLGSFIHQDDKPVLLERARNFIKNKFPRVDFGKLGPIGFSKKPGNETTIVSFGTKGGETEIFKKDGKGLYQKFTDKFKTSLGPEAESLIAQDNEEIRENRQRLREAEKQLRDAEKLASEREKAAQEVQNMRNRIERNQAQIEKLQEEQGTNVESETELRRLQQLKKIIKRILKTQKKRWRLSRNKQKTKPNNKKASINLEQAWLPKRAKETPWNRGSTTQERWMS